MSTVKTDFEDLEATGGRIHFFLQRCHYLYDHPEGGYGAQVFWSDAHGALISLLTGCITDLLATCVSPNAEIAVDARPLGAATVVLELTARVPWVLASRGGQAFQRLAESVRTRLIEDRHQLVIEVTGESLRLALGPPVMDDEKK